MQAQERHRQVRDLGNEVALSGLLMSLLHGVTLGVHTVIRTQEMSAFILIPVTTVRFSLALSI